MRANIHRFVVGEEHQQRQRNLNLRLFQWIDDISTIIGSEIFQRFLLSNIITSEGYQGFPDYGVSVDLPDNHGQYTFGVDGGGLTGDYTATPPQGSIPTGVSKLRIDIKLNPGPLMRDEMNYRRDIASLGTSAKIYEENHHRNLRDIKSVNNSKHLTIYKTQKLYKPYKYLKFLGIKLKFIRRK